MALCKVFPPTFDPNTCGGSKASRRVVARSDTEEAKHGHANDTGPADHGNIGIGSKHHSTFHPPRPAFERSATVAQRPHRQLFRDPAGARRLRAGHDLPGRQAGDAPTRRRPPQHALSRLQQADGPGGGRRSAGHRHQRGDLGIPQCAGRRPPPGARRPPRRLLSAAVVGLHRRRPDPRDGMGPYQRG